MRRCACWPRARPAGWWPFRGENYVDYDITEALQMTKSLDQHTYEVMRALTGVH